jgi:modification methylase
MGTPAVPLPPSTLGTPAGELPLAVWPCAQTSPQYQRAGRYLPASTAHPAKMLPELARRIVAEYSPPGGLVVDPLCGIGTTLVEATRLGRDAVGVELEPRWADLARANLAHAHTRGASGSGRVVTGDARRLPDLLGAELTGRVAVVVTSPPYGSSVHGQVDARPGQGVVKYDNAYSADRANLGRVRQQALVAALAEILAGCHELLRPGGLLVLTARPWRRREQLVDFPGQLVRAAEAADLVPFERDMALLVGLRGDRLVGRPSFFQLDRVRKARARGLPLRIIAHEDVLVFRRPSKPVSSRELKDPQREPEGLVRPGSGMDPRAEGDRPGEAHA